MVTVIIAYSRQEGNGIMITKTLTSAEAQALFNKHAFLINGRDVIPCADAERLLGKEAVAYADKAGADRNLYSLGDGKLSMRFLTYKGFVKAVTYHNIIIATE